MMFQMSKSYQFVLCSLAALMSVVCRILLNSKFNKTSAEGIRRVHG